jgi:diguanylate cyclase (GGDEF)-like protein
LRVDRQPALVAFGVRVKSVITLVGIVLLCAATARAADTPGPTTIEEISRLSAAQADQELPVSFPATVTFFRPYDHTLFVQDGESAMYVSARTDLKLVPGDRILVHGTTRGSFRNYVQSAAIVLTRHGDLPTPIAPTFSEMIRGQVDCRLVRVHAVIRSAEIVPSSLLLLPATALRMLIDGEEVAAEVNGSNGEALRNLLDAEVEITGVVSGNFDNKMQQTGVLLHIQSLADVKILHRSEVDPWSLPITPMDRVIIGYSKLDRTQRMRVHGTVTYFQPGSGMVLQDGTKSLWITTDSFEPVRVGDLADAIGFPDVKDGFLSLTRSEVRDSAIPAPVIAPLYSWKDLAEGGNHSRGHMYDLVSVEGRVVAEVRQATRDEYVLETGGHLTSAVFHHPGSLTRAPLQAMKPVPVGAQVRVTGICMLENADPFLGDVPFSILLRSFDDVAVIAPAPWLNVRNLSFLVGLLTTAILVVVARSWRVERRMRRHTASLASIEKRRGKILEAMNADRPLDEILDQITAMASSQLNGAPCWCEMEDGIKAGHRPHPAPPPHPVQCHPIGSASISLGKICVASPAKAEDVEEVLSKSGWLVALAVENSRLHSDLVHRSEFDLLTDVHNRFSLDKEIDDLIHEAQSSRHAFGLIYIDLDEFKAVNDRYGHRTGDRYLQLVASRMRRSLRPGNILARLGGDEFAVLTPSVENRASLEEIALRLERCFDDPFVIDEAVIHGAASIGCALYGANGSSRDELLNFADAAMYEKKRQNRRLRELLDNPSAEAVSKQP